MWFLGGEDTFVLEGPAGTMNLLGPAMAGTFLQLVIMQAFVCARLTLFALIKLGDVPSWTIQFMMYFCVVVITSLMANPKLQLCT